MNKIFSVNIQFAGQSKSLTSYQVYAKDYEEAVEIARSIAINDIYIEDIYPSEDSGYYVEISFFGTSDNICTESYYVPYAKTEYQASVEAEYMAYGDLEVVD